MKNASFGLALLFLVSGMSVSLAKDGNQKAGPQRVSINVSNFKSSANLSDFLEVVKLIPLETSKESLIGEITKVIQFRDNLYVFDLSTQKVFRFNTDGKFLGLIGQRGKGPGEFIEMHDFLVDTLKEFIYIVDFRKVHIYSTTGKWIKTANTDFMAFAMRQAVNDEFVFYGGGRDDRIFRTNSEFKTINSFFPFSLAYRMTPHYPLFNFQGETVFHIPTCDTLFSLNLGKPNPLFYLDFNGKNFTNKDFARLSPADQNNVYSYLLNSGKYVMCQGFLPLKTSAIVLLIYANTVYWGIYNLNTNQYTMVSLKKLVNDISGPFMYFYPSGMTNDEFIFAMPPDVLIKDRTTSFYKKNVKVLEGISELSNPVLLFSKSKI